MLHARAAAGTAVLLLCLDSLAATSPQDQQPPQPFRSGTTTVRVDATVIDRSGRPVSTLTAHDFEVREDDVVQPVTSFKFLANTGQPSDDRSLPIRSRQHAAAEAARDDVRVFLIFWDEYHIEPYVNALRARAALSRIMMTAFGPTDLVAIIDPLTPSSAIEFSRDRRALADRIHTLQGRRGVYLPPRSAAEEAQLEVVNWNPPAVEGFRAQVSVSAIKAAAAHLGTLREGRKTMIVVTEALSAWNPGRGMRGDAAMDARPGTGPAPPALSRQDMRREQDDQNTARDMVRTVNDSNTAVHVLDPRGLNVASGSTLMLETLAYGSGGELHRTNDPGASVQRIVSQASATYLLGYTKDMPQDGRFHEIKVRVKRGGYEVRARAGYWAPRAEDVARAKAVAAAAVLPEPIAAAFASLNPANSSRLVDIWTGTWPLADGRSLLTVAWTRVPAVPGGPVPATVSVRLTSGSGAPIDQVLEPGGTTFEIGTGRAELAMLVLDKAGEVIDRENRAIQPAPETPLGLTPVVYLARTPAEARTLSDPKAPVHAGREFVRTDRLAVRLRTYGTSAASAEVTGRLIDRRGATLIPLAIAGPANGWHHLDLPLASIAPGDFALVFEARSGEHRAEAIVPVRIRR
jgi:VWFA-related protein